MGTRQLTLLVMIYVTLDLANPMMPGAVQLFGASFEKVDGYQRRAGDAQGPPLPAARRHGVCLAPPRKLALRGAVRIAPRFSLGTNPLRAIKPSSGIAPSSPDDD
jgi:hypothetical protein